MFCSKCGTELLDDAKFCSKCGKHLIENTGDGISADASGVPTPVTTIQSACVTPQTHSEGRQTPKKRAIIWIIPVIIVGLAIFVGIGFLLSNIINQKQEARIEREATEAARSYVDVHYGLEWGDEATSVEKKGSTNYIICYDIHQEYDLWKSTGSVKVSVQQEDEEWTVDVLEENIEYVFEKNENWYHISAPRNRQYLIKMTELKENEVRFEYYTYELGSMGGRDSFGHDTDGAEMKYDGENQCFTFVFMGGDWRITGDSVQYNRYEVGAHYEYYQSGRFVTLSPVNPEDYWWYEKAKNANDP